MDETKKCRSLKLSSNSDFFCQLWTWVWEAGVKLNIPVICSRVESYVPSIDVIVSKFLPETHSSTFINARKIQKVLSDIDKGIRIPSLQLLLKVTENLLSVPFFHKRTEFIGNLFGLYHSIALLLFIKTGVEVDLFNSNSSKQRELKWEVIHNLLGFKDDTLEKDFIRVSEVYCECKSSYLQTKLKLRKRKKCENELKERLQKIFLDLIKLLPAAALQNICNKDLRNNLLQQDNPAYNILLENSALDGITETSLNNIIDEINLKVGNTSSNEARNLIMHILPHDAPNSSYNSPSLKNNTVSNSVNSLRSVRFRNENQNKFDCVKETPGTSDIVIIQGKVWEFKKRNSLLQNKERLIGSQDVLEISQSESELPNECGQVIDKIWKIKSRESYKSINDSDSPTKFDKEIDDLDNLIGHVQTLVYELEEKSKGLKRKRRQFINSQRKNSVQEIECVELERNDGLLSGTACNNVLDKIPIGKNKENNSDTNRTSVVLNVVNSMIAPLQYCIDDNFSLIENTGLNASNESSDDLTIPELSRYSKNSTSNISDLTVDHSPRNDPTDYPLSGIHSTSSEVISKSPEIPNQLSFKMRRQNVSPKFMNKQNLPQKLSEKNNTNESMAANNSPLSDSNESVSSISMPVLSPYTNIPPGNYARLKKLQRLSNRELNDKPINSLIPVVELIPLSKSELFKHCDPIHTSTFKRKSDAEHLPPCPKRKKTCNLSTIKLPVTKLHSAHEGNAVILESDNCAVTNSMNHEKTSEVTLLSEKTISSKESVLSSGKESYKEMEIIFVDVNSNNSNPEIPKSKGRPVTSTPTRSKIELVKKTPENKSNEKKSTPEKKSTEKKSTPEKKQRNAETKSDWKSKALITKNKLTLNRRKLKTFKNKLTASPIKSQNNKISTKSAEKNVSHPMGSKPKKTNKKSSKKKKVLIINTSLWKKKGDVTPNKTSELSVSRLRSLSPNCGQTKDCLSKQKVNVSQKNIKETSSSSSLSDETSTQSLFVTPNESPSQITLNGTSDDKDSVESFSESFKSFETVCDKLNSTLIKRCYVLLSSKEVCCGGEKFQVSF